MKCPSSASPVINPQGRVLAPGCQQDGGGCWGSALPPNPGGTDPHPLLGPSWAPRWAVGAAGSPCPHSTGHRLVLSSATACLSVPGHVTQPSLPTAATRGPGLRDTKPKLPKSEWTNRTLDSSCCPRTEPGPPVPGEGGRARAGGFGVGHGAALAGLALGWWQGVAGQEVTVQEVAVQG